MLKTVWRYLSSHWRGQQGLAWSFWVNLLLIRALIYLAQNVFAPAQVYRDLWFWVFLLAVAAQGVLLTWQAVGLVRASERHIGETGAMAQAWGAQLGLVAVFLWVLVDVLGAWQMTLPAPEGAITIADWQAERASKYSIEPTEDGQTLALTGSLELGIVTHLKNQLAAYPQVQQIVLTSQGGNIFQARGLSKTISDHGLATRVVSECSSACTTVFIGGTERELAANARLGFHQYRVDAVNTVLGTDPLDQQAADGAIFVGAGAA